MATTRITSRREEENMKDVKNIIKITATFAILFSFFATGVTTTTAEAQLTPRIPPTPTPLLLTTPLTLGAANTTSTIVTMINANIQNWNPSALDITPQHWELLKTQDPLLARYEQIFITCYNNILAGTYTPASNFQCLGQMEQGEAVWCTFATYHQEKCDSTQTLTSYYYASMEYLEYQKRAGAGAVAGK